MNSVLLLVALASPVLAQQHPVIPGAEALAEPAAQGRVLIDTLNCVACHDIADYEPVAPLPGPQIQHSLAGKYTLEQLSRWIANPHEMKPGTRMPDFFREEDQNAPEKIEALAEFLLSLPPMPPAEPIAKGDVETGRHLYHTIGCVACHAPEADYKPESETASAPEPLKGPSVPLELGKLWSPDALVAYLMNPESPAMPNFRLDTVDAAHLAAYIQREAVPWAPAQETYFDSGMVARGAGLFLSEGCAKCHGNPPGALASGTRVRRKLTPARLEEGCLAEDSGRYAPVFGLSEAQRTAIRAAIEEPEKELSPIEATLGAMNCYACHQRGGTGGPEAGRKPYFGVTDQLALSFGDFGNIPPKLDLAGRKLTEEWFAKLFKGDADASVRLHMSTRMPAFDFPAVKKLPELLATADARQTPIEMDTSGLAKHHRAVPGRDLIGIKGLGCVTCHGMKGVKALGAPTVDLTHTAARLQPAYFAELLLDPAATNPGTLMPPLFLTRKDRDKEIEQIWTYLKEIDQQRLPDGLLKTDEFELKPKDRPIVFRTFLEGAGFQAIAVGFPQGAHVAFDTLEVRWAEVWQGRFLDARTTWDERAAEPAKPLGDAVKLLESPGALVHEGGAKLEFDGYRVDSSGVPTFLYRAGAVQVEDTIRAIDGKTLQRTVHLRGDGAGWKLVKLNGELTPITFTGGAATLEETYAW